MYLLKSFQLWYSPGPCSMLNNCQNWNFYNWSCHNPCLQKTDSAIYIHDDHLYLERVAALTTTISFKENGYQSCHVTKIKRVIHGWKWFVKTLNTDIKRLVGFFSHSTKLIWLSFKTIDAFGHLAINNYYLFFWQKNYRWFKLLHIYHNEKLLLLFESIFFKSIS